MLDFGYQLELNRSNFIGTAVVMLLVSNLLTFALLSMVRRYVAGGGDSRGISLRLLFPSVFIGTTTAFVLFAVWFSDPGHVHSMYVVAESEETRLAVVYEDNYQGCQSSGADQECQIRTHRMTDGRRVGRTGQLHGGGCQLIGQNSRYLWMLADGPGRGEPILVDLYTGTRRVSAGDLLEGAPGSGDFEIDGVTASGSALKLALQDGKPGWITAGGELTRSEPPAPADSATAANVESTTKKIDHPRLHRAQELVSSCDCPIEQCGRLVVFSTTSLGSGEQKIGLLEADETLKWEAKVREKTRAEEIAGIADVDGDCVLVTWDPLLVWIDRATGEVSRRSALR